MRCFALAGPKRMFRNAPRRDEYPKRRHTDIPATQGGGARQRKIVMQSSRMLSATVRHAVILLAASFLLGRLELCPAFGQDTKQAEVVSIENGVLRVGVDRRNGRLLQVVDLESAENLAGDAAAIDGPWELKLTTNGRSLTLKPEDAREFRYKVSKDEQHSIRLIWSDFTLAAASECTVEVTIRLVGDRPMSSWGIAVDKPVGLGLDRIQFPRVCGLRRQADERLAVPAWMGQMLANPRSLLSGKDGRGRRLEWGYPGRLSMQCLAYYQDGGCGFYAASDDNRAARKTFAIRGTSGGDVDFEMMHYPPSQVTQEDRYTLPYRVLLGTFRGDWITAAERYRTWAVDQPWARESRVRKGLVPDWVLDTHLWVWNRGRSPGVLPPAAALQERLGLPVSVFWHWWHGCPYDIGFPEYLPPREGTEAFRQAVARAHEDDLRMLVYMNQRAWGMSSASWQAEGAERFAVKGRDGKVRPEIYNTFTRQALASMCLATSFWRDKYAGLAEEAFKDLGVDGIYMDQACSHKPCYDPNHGHPPGGGDSWIEGFRTLSETIRKRCEGDPPIVLAGEGCREAWLPRLDLMLALKVSKERYSSPTDPWEVIPFFQAVYHTCAVTYGNYSSLTMPPYDDLWPAKFAPDAPLALLDRKYSRQFYLEQARTFVWGQQLTLANFREAHLEQRPAEIEYLIRLARVRSRATKYLLHGEFLRPPELNAPKTTSDFSRLSIYAGQNSRLTSFTKQHPLALAGAWRAADGDVAIAIASVADQPLSLSFTLDADYYRLPQPPRACRIDAGGRRPLKLLAGDDAKLAIEMPPREAWIIEFSRN